MQSLLDIAEYYGERYHVIYGAEKTKITVVGFEIDGEYYKKISPWKIDSKKINVTDSNEHLGQIVSGIDPEQKNVDLRISKARAFSFALL